MVRRGWDWMRKYGGWLKKGGARERRPYGRTSRARESNGEEISDLKWLCRHRVHLRGRWNLENAGSRYVGANRPHFRACYTGGRGKPSPLRGKFNGFGGRQQSHLKFEMALLISWAFTMATKCRETGARHAEASSPLFWHATVGRAQQASAPTGKFNGENYG